MIDKISSGSSVWVREKVGFMSMTTLPAPASACTIPIPKGIDKKMQRIDTHASKREHVHWKEKDLSSSRYVSLKNSAFIWHVALQALQFGTPFAATVPIDEFLLRACCLAQIVCLDGFAKITKQHLIETYQRVSAFIPISLEIDTL